MSPGVSLLMFTIILLLPVSYRLTNKTYGGEPETRTLKAIAGFGGFQDRCITSYANSPYGEQSWSRTNFSETCDYTAFGTLPPMLSIHTGAGNET